MEVGGTAGGGADGARDVLRLNIVAGNGAGETVEVADEFVIGRQAPGAGSLANDIEISRTHARITAEPDGRFVIEDLGSTNGTYVNGARIETPVALEAGDRIEVGGSALLVQATTVQPAPAPPPSVVHEPREPSNEATPLGPLASFSLRIEVDPAAGRVTVALDDDSDQIGLVHIDGRWHLERPPSEE